MSHNAYTINFIESLKIIKKELFCEPQSFFFPLQITHTSHFKTLSGSDFH